MLTSTKYTPRSVFNFSTLDKNVLKYKNGIVGQRITCTKRIFNRLRTPLLFTTILFSCTALMRGNDSETTLSAVCFVVSHFYPGSLAD
ncbi:hypothetical protein NQ317_018449 [Molorchus minor]|uniref:Uncharacterized protein n=1 Tax=Molorchus minor TaxID=1323400 RepID=A0ABQ9JG34_9CUCU|nr:hypothetical protein NQ317_018449 [Molorchus minor]